MVFLLTGPRAFKASNVTCHKTKAKQSQCWPTFYSFEKKQQQHLYITIDINRKRDKFTNIDFI